MGKIWQKMSKNLRFLRVDFGKISPRFWIFLGKNFAVLGMFSGKISHQNFWLSSGKFYALKLAFSDAPSPEDFLKSFS